MKKQQIIDVWSWSQIWRRRQPMYPSIDLRTRVDQSDALAPQRFIPYDQSD